MDKKLKIGFHSSISFGLLNSIKQVENLGGNSVQIFLKSPRSWQAKVIDLQEAKITKKYVIENDIFLIGHSSYLLNFCKDYKENIKAINSLIDDMKRIDLLGGVGVVLHIGKQLKLSKEEAYNNLHKSISLILEKTPESIKLLFENTSGQGTEIGYKIDELKQVLNLFSEKEQERICFCFDTAHGFAAGYDFGSKKGVQIFYLEFNEKIGWDKLECIHFNDSKKDLGSKVDRHQDIGFGKISEEGLKEFVLICFKTDKPLILETPCEFKNYFFQIEKIKSWV